jgi:hypothetical protein
VITATGTEVMALIFSITERMREWRVGSPEPERERWSIGALSSFRKPFTSFTISFTGTYSFLTSVFSVVFPI